MNTRRDRIINSQYHTSRYNGGVLLHELALLCYFMSEKAASDFVDAVQRGATLLLAERFDGEAHWTVTGACTDEEFAAANADDLELCAKVRALHSGEKAFVSGMWSRGVIVERI
jgi:hypothetical protein